MPSGFPKRMLGQGWVPTTEEIHALWPQVVPKLVKGELRVYEDATWGWQGGPVFGTKQSACPEVCCFYLLQYLGTAMPRFTITA
jgi:hypothetical protein